MNLLILTVLATVATARAKIAYQGGLVVEGPISSCSYSENYKPPGALYNQLGSPYPKQQLGIQASYAPAALQNNYEVNNPSALCSCGNIHNSEASVPLVTRGPRQVFGAPSRFVFPPKYATGPPAIPPTVLSPQIPPAPDPTTVSETPTTSHIMKIPRRSDSSSFTITLNAPDSSPSNTIYSSLPPSTTSFIPPPRPIYYTQPPPLLASCPATVFYPATIPYSVYPPPFTCPARPPPQPNIQPNITPSPLRFTQPFNPTSTSLPIPSTKPNNDDEMIASFTSTIPDTRSYNVTTIADKRDPLLTFKLLTAAASKTQKALTPAGSSLEAQAASKDCSMPIPPVIV